MARRKKSPASDDATYDAVVIGTGPSGESAAIKLAKSGKRVAVIDSRSQVGGSCIHVGTIPSKALRQTVYNFIRYQRNPLFKNYGELKPLPLSAVLGHARRVVDQQVDTHKRFFERNLVDMYTGGRAELIDPHRVRIHMEDGGGETLSFDHLVIASGSRPYHPSDISFEHPRVFDSDKILTLDYPINKIIIYGAGVIGCEYASIFVGLGYKVDLVNTQPKLLSFLDDEISDALSYYLSEMGVVILNNEQYETLEAHNDNVVLNLQSGKKLKGDAILWCNGRSGNTEQMGLESVGIVPNSRGQIEVNDHYQTAVPHIYAAGDVIGWPSLGSASYDQGRAAAAHIVGEDTPPVSHVPTGIYTIPEISSVGKTEQELTAEKVPYEIGKVFFRDLARAQIVGDTAGMLKILFHRDTLEILGIHSFGANSAEIIHIGQAIMLSPHGNNVKYFAETTFNYPTMAEAYRVAALNGLNRLSE